MGRVLGRRPAVMRERGSGKYKQACSDENKGEQRIPHGRIPAGVVEYRTVPIDVSMRTAVTWKRDGARRLGNATRNIYLIIQ